MIVHSDAVMLSGTMLAKIATAVIIIHCYLESKRK